MLAKRATVVSALILLLAGWVVAESDQAAHKAQGATPAKAAPSGAGATAEQIQQWVRDLGADRASLRDRAVERLIQAGAPAVAPVAQVAKGDSLEVTIRGVSVLKALMDSKDEATAEAAKAALKKLAADESHEAGKQAQRALEQAQPKRRPMDAREARLRQLLAARMQIAGVAAGGANAIRMSVSTTNGEKQIDVTENGRTIRITEGKGGITVRVAEKPEGDKKPEPKPKEYKAATAAELRTKHPEAHKLYEKYAKRQGAGFVVNLGNLGVARAVRPQRIAPAGVARAARPRRNLRSSAKLLHEALDELGKTIEKLKAAEKGKLSAEEIAALAKQLEAAREKIAEARKGLLK